MKQVVFHAPALRTLARIPRNEADKIRRKIYQYAADPAAQKANVKKLQGRAGFRLRVGNWRVIFDANGDVLDVLEVDSRGSIY
ncbi:MULTISPECIES: type II toxin-antitoxin system RelE/ParE family toxin [unclassified Shinella]|uniref:type II toxin-antitoxin system RelE family toxin n=1 Tax=Shinella TaxID=323620 RepID=UPI00234F9EDA|nr:MULTISPECIES: type II toxin-antitoxin system RelE/ParE family toxin [unclassified Shinella]MCO5139375.1 type II toxin-antitoxin system RelE/ParE family toxin [Shinella sp.]MDC7255897.1 type II toxin-antitoxin system RelE/ParE family toxin [Shinella sp. YE25]